MKEFIHRVRTTRLGFLAVLLLLLWAKTLFAYFYDFSLGLDGGLQWFIAIINPLGTSAFLLSLALYVRKPGRAYFVGLLVYVLLGVLLLSNVLYYRELSDFLTVTTIFNVGKISTGLGASSFNTLMWHDLAYFFDWIIIVAAYLGYGVVNIWRFLNKQPLRWPHFGFVIDRRPPSYHFPQAVSVVAATTFAATIAVSEFKQPQLLTRTFDRTYIVKYLGLTPFTVYDGVKAAQTNTVRSSADSSDAAKVRAYTQAHYAAPNPEYFGEAKGKNVIIIHLESFQQFLIGLKIKGKEVTPFLNSLIKQDDTLSYDNFFHEVGQGRTSDAENMLETSTFGLATGSLFSSLGTDNTFQAAPAILNQTDHYTTAVFHGGSGGFWNREQTYKSMGYQYFFDGNYYDQDGAAQTQYGIKDKLMFAESAKYLERLQQPFYAKVITTTNHYPYYISATDSDFPDAGTKDPYVNGYFKTAHYLDQSLKEFFAYLKASGLEQHSLVVLYGDHYGISNDRASTLGPLVGLDSDNWTDYDNAKLQRVPLILHMPGLKGGIRHTYGGEIDVLPTLLHLLGVNTEKYMQFGTDLLSAQHNQVVAFRNHNFVTPKYTVVGDSIYSNATGELVTVPAATQQKLKQDQAAVDEKLDMSDLLNEKNLLRFYVPDGFTPIDPRQYDYTKSLRSVLTVAKDLGKASTSLYSEHGNHSTTGLYRTDAPEVQTDTSVITKFPSTTTPTKKATTSSSISTN
ncbi:LTA synthase family protein [Lacticaseibacillus nasuensis]|uniref:LTA synthase family protein n=1 Tax=Lacticaseibacillus nasuensis TaxID=944671 RepID=UPI0022483252|nr:LTA synthase family protein [Lacticaseibacillus nasuensis]MCX2455409.1 LTA synthase family protein [Lacticaseibacillus nasuensis]